MTTRYRKNTEIDEERLDDELLLLHRKTLQVRVLNESATVLWDALDEFGSAQALIDLFGEARSEIAPVDIENYVTGFLRDLTECEFIKVLDPSVP